MSNARIVEEDIICIEMICAAGQVGDSEALRVLRIASVLTISLESF
jgi:hypothetical protein